MPDYEAELFFSMLIISAASVYWLISYLLRGFGMYGIAKNLGLKTGFLAFIPIAWRYLMGDLAGEIKVGKRSIKNPGLWTLLLPFFTSILVVPMFIIYITIIRLAAHNDQMGYGGYMDGFFTYFGILMLVIILVGIIIKTLYLTLNGLVRFKTYQKYTDDSSAAIHMVIGLFIPLYYQIYYFILRNRKPVIFNEVLIAEEQGITDEVIAEDALNENKADSEEN